VNAAVHDAALARVADVERPDEALETIQQIIFGRNLRTKLKWIEL
jgi:hypothetical protein